MNDDDIYPNESSNYLAEPAEQVVERQKDKAKTLAGLEAIIDVIKRLAERIEFYEKVTSIPDEVRLDTEKFLIMHNSYAFTADNLKSELEYLEALVADYGPK